MPDTMITIPDGQLIDYTVSLTLGVIDPTFRWTDSLGGSTDRRHGANIPIDDVAAYQQANTVDRPTAICAIVKAQLAAKANSPVETFGLSLTPYTPPAPPQE